jgi:biotin transport system substrate-specific component
MTQFVPTARNGAFVPFRLDERSLGVKIAAVMLGTLFLAAASWVEVPMVPVPVNMQTFAVTLVGALMGWRLGAITVLAWLGEAAIGMPVLSGGAGGAMHFVGPTGGYLVAFPIVAALVGYLAERGWTRLHVLVTFAVMLAGNALILAIGATWLGAMIGFEGAILHGVTPFIAGAVLKSALAVATVELALRSGKAG